MPRRKKNRAIDGPWGCLLAIPVLFALMLFSLLAMPVLLVLGGIFAWRFRRKMKAVGRYISWQELQQRHERGEGTLILEANDHGKGGNFWWSDADIKSLSPVPVLLDDNTGRHSHMRDHPFSIWCHANFTSPETGRAMLVQSGGGGSDKFWKECEARGILYSQLRRGTSAQDRRLLEILKSERPAIIPKLITALKDPDEDMRDLAANALGAFGAEASEAVPALIEALKDDPDGDSFFALTDIGPPALPALQELTQHAEGKLRKDAQDIIRSIELKQKPQSGA